MDKHVEECICYVESCCPWMGDCTCQCICDILRACEQRVRNQDIATHHADLKEAKALLASRDEAWFAGVEAAREAVAAMPLTGGWTTPDGVIEEIDKAKTIAAIDALRKEN